MILKCSRCAHDVGLGAKFQDEQYGKGMRVHNKTHAGRIVKYRCTICKNEQDK